MRILTTSAPAAAAWPVGRRPSVPAATRRRRRNTFLARPESGRVLRQMILMHVEMLLLLLKLLLTVM